MTDTVKMQQVLAINSNKKGLVGASKFPLEILLAGFLQPTYLSIHFPFLQDCHENIKFCQLVLNASQAITTILLNSLRVQSPALQRV